MRGVAGPLVAILLWTPFSGASNAEEGWLEFRPSSVKLVGRFELVVRLGPPNYGEDPKTDLRTEVPMLWLDEPIRVRGKPGDEVDNEPIEGVRVVQLLLPSEVNRDELLGKDVVVTGRLTHATRGAEFAPVVLDVAKAELDLAANEATNASGCERARTQREIEECARRDLEAVDRVLEGAYRKYESSLVGEQRTMLAKAQEAWQRYRDASCEASSAVYSGGTLAPTQLAACRARLARERVDELKEIYDEPPFPAEKKHD